MIIHGIWHCRALATWRALRGTGIPYFVFTHVMLDPWFKCTYPLKHLKKWVYWPWDDYRVLRDATAVMVTTEQERLLARQSFWLYKSNELVLGYTLPPRRPMPSVSAGPSCSASPSCAASACCCSSAASIPKRASIC